MDTGLACFLLGWNTPEQLVNGASWGHIFETYAICEILKSYYNQGIVPLHLYYCRDKERNEIDLIIEEGGMIYPIEIKTTSDPSKSTISSFKALKNISDKIVGMGAVICLSKQVLPLTDSVWILPVSLI